MKENREPKEKQSNPIVQRVITNPSVNILRCSLQTVKIESEKKQTGTDKNGSPIVQNLQHHTLTFSEDTLRQLEREGAFEN